MNLLRNLLALLALVSVPPAAVVACLLALTTFGDASGRPPAGEYRVQSYYQERGRLQIDRSLGGLPIEIGRRAFAHGLGTCAHSEIRLIWTGPATRLSGYCGVDDAARGRGSVVCKVSSDRRLLWQSPVIRGGEAPRSFEVPVRGLSGVDLFVEDAGDGAEADLASWADLRLTLGEGAP